MLEPTKKRHTPQRRSCSKTTGGVQSQSNQIKYQSVGDPQTGEQWYQRSSPTVVKVLNHTSGLWSLGTQQRVWESPENMTSKASGIWLQDFHRTGGNRDSSLGGHKQNAARTETQRKGAATAQETEPKLPASVGWFPMGAWVGRGSPQGWGRWQQLSAKVPLGINPLGVCH